MEKELISAENANEISEKATKKPGAPMKYKTAKSLERAIEKYFRSISATVPMAGIDGREILNDNGEPIMKVEYLIPPSVVSMCLYLGIDKRTWANYSNPALHPEFAEVTARAMLRHEAYLVEQSIVREKSVSGILFNLENNYGYKQKKEVELGEATRSTLEAEPVSLREKLLAIAAASADIGVVPEDAGE